MTKLTDHDHLHFLTTRTTQKYIFNINKPELKVVKRGCRARKGETTCKPETDKFILKMRRHWITSGTVF